MGRLIAIMTILVIAGCASPSANKKIKPLVPLVSSTLPTYNLAGYRPAFKDGYIDGCETAKKSSYGLKDEKRFAEENQYRNGWKDGYNLCLGK
jgi:hypothetical protein|tara:strand:- start:216 stop:494 length:279 start_codon:yes stop_codon:yes gene_type:complete